MMSRSNEARKSSADLAISDLDLGSGLGFGGFLLRFGASSTFSFTGSGFGGGSIAAEVLLPAV